MISKSLSSVAIRGNVWKIHCAKSVRIGSYSGPHFRDTEYFLIQSECGKMRTRRTLNTDTFHAVIWAASITWLPRNNLFPRSMVYSSISNSKLWNPTFQCMGIFRLAIIHLRESPTFKTTHVKDNCASPCNIVKERSTRTWFINETQG